MVRKVVLLISSLLLSAAVGWAAYEFWKFYHPAPFGVAVAFIGSVWYAILNSYPRRKWMKEILGNILLFGIGAGLAAGFFIYLGLSAEYSSYDGGMMKSSEELLYIGLKVFSFFLVSTLSSAIGYTIAANSRRLLKI